MKGLKTFAPETDLDRRLLLGVIERDAYDTKVEIKKLAAYRMDDDMGAED